MISDIRGKNEVHTMIVSAFCLEAVFRLHSGETQGEHGFLTELRRHRLEFGETDADRRCRGDTSVIPSSL